jgi:hypothetical protein
LIFFPLFSSCIAAIKDSLNRSCEIPHTLYSSTCLLFSWADQ